ncbi:MAG: glycoside hydrolase family 99-like domain-containing protein [Verrucomicrobiaceae bacterium]|nr:glycoside hydrolase family 99-like domain-containing protein [Verrucomicrobiaceae bacterium]
MKHALASLASLLLSSAAVGDERPIVGAIRWDGWYGDGSVVKAVEASLGQPKYHFRLPWFARVVSEGKVSINGDAQSIMEQEIEYAAQAGLNYWAFLDYLDQMPGMSIGLKRYLAAKDKKGLRYCLIEEGARLDGAGSKAWSTLVEHFRHPDYQTVLNGRPLLCLFGKTAKLGKAEWDDLKHQTVAAGLKAPYLVLMGWNADKDREELGFDAISEYACAGKGYTTDPVTYAQLTSHHVKENLWSKWKRERTPCITFATTGWDTRPRQERPPPWCSWVMATPDPTPPAQQKPLMDATTATPDELAAHLRDAIAWTQANRDLNPANVIIIYAWNEHDEGGWLQPTLGADGKPNDERIRALGRVLRLAVTPPP